MLPSNHFHEMFTYLFIVCSFTNASKKEWNTRPTFVTDSKTFNREFVKVKKAWLCLPVMLRLSTWCAICRQFAKKKDFLTCSLHPELFWVKQWESNVDPWWWWSKNMKTMKNSSKSARAKLRKCQEPWLEKLNTTEHLFCYTKLWRSFVQLMNTIWWIKYYAEIEV